MGRPRKERPVLFRKGQGNYRFRWQTDGKDKEYNTGTCDRQEANNFLEDFLTGKSVAMNQIRKKKNPAEITHLVMKAVDSEIEVFPLEDAFEFWVSRSPNFRSSSTAHQNKRKAWFKKFSSWCRSQEIENMHEVDADAANRFAGVLHEEKYCPGNMNEYLRFLSGVFRKIGTLKSLSSRNPFSSDLTPYAKVSKKPEASHMAFEHDMIPLILNATAEEGADWRDLFMVGYQTGMRLKDAALFRWDEIDGEYIEYTPEKTILHGNKARLPISPMLAVILNERRKQKQESPYVNPLIAELYLSNRLKKRCQKIVVKALGKETTQLSKEGRQRKINGCLYGFHSFRTTFMSLLAAENTPFANAMEMLGWESYEMVLHYTKLLKKVREAMDKSNKNLLDNLKGLQCDIPQPCSKSEPFRPDKETMTRLMEQYSDVAIGKIYGISSKAVGNWLKRFGLKREKRIESPITEEEIKAIREKLMKKAA